MERRREGKLFVWQVHEADLKFNSHLAREGGRERREQRREGGGGRNGGEKEGGRVVCVACA